jgi:hypothetical protein
VVLTDRALPEVGHHDPLTVHEEAGVEAVPGLAENVPHRSGGQEALHLVLNRGDGFETETAVIAGILLPQGAHHRIADPRRHALPERVIREKARQGKDRKSAVIEERGKGMSQDVFEPRPPASAPYAAEGGKHPGHDERRFVLWHLRQEVQAHRRGAQASSSSASRFARSSASRSAWVKSPGA